MNIHPIPPNAIGEYWGEAAHHLERIASLDVDFAYECCLEGAFQLWLAVENGEALAAALTEVTSEPDKRVTIRNAAGRDMKKWVRPLLDAIEAWAVGLTERPVQVIGRSGWVRALESYGYRQIAVVLEGGHGQG